MVCADTESGLAHTVWAWACGGSDEEGHETGDHRVQQREGEGEK